MSRICLVMGVLGFLQMCPSLAMSLGGDDPIKINFCCPDGEMMRVRLHRDLLGEEFITMTECVGRKDVKNTLEGMEVSVLDSIKQREDNQTEFVKRKLSKLDNKMLKCGRGLQIYELYFNQPSEIGSTYYYHMRSVVISEYLQLLICLASCNCWQKKLKLKQKITVWQKLWRRKVVRNMVLMEL